MKWFTCLIRLLAFMLFTVFGTSMVLAGPLVASDITYFQTETTPVGQADDVGFAARAPPLAVTNVEVTGGVTVVYGSAFALYGQETVVALLGFDTDQIATNRTPNPIPVDQGLVRTSDIRSGLTVGNNRTVAYSKVNVSGLSGNVVGVSGQANRGSSYNGATVAGNTTRTGPGRQDAEVKILDHLRSQLTPESSGTIKLFVDQPAARGGCQHCTNAILDFRRDFPNIRLDVSAN